MTVIVTHKGAELVHFDFNKEKSILDTVYLDKNEMPEVDGDAARKVLSMRLEVTEDGIIRLVISAVLLDRFTDEAKAILFGEEGMANIAAVLIVYSDKTKDVAMVIANNPKNVIPFKAVPQKEREVGMGWLEKQPLILPE
jgi:hypothetical protein